MLSRRRFLKASALAPAFFLALAARAGAAPAPGMGQEADTAADVEAAAGAGQATDPGPVPCGRFPRRFPFSIPERKVYVSHFPVLRVNSE